MDVHVAAAQDGNTAASVRAARGDVALRFERLIEGRPYTVRVFPTWQRPVAPIVTAGPDDSPAVAASDSPRRANWTGMAVDAGPRRRRAAKRHGG